MIFKREPVIIQAGLLAVFNLLGAFGVVGWSCTQITAVNAAIAAVLGVITRQLVTPLHDPRDAAGRPLRRRPVGPGDGERTVA
ncbi:hypothetical protein O7632_07590 [Solwaraspora sp. WMMD406]|uniref:hypothetical protein n=1 Tax=Solwaraspora sp. WMMD406 TaxID=3016095 RepID=UPI002417B3FD|nr:hypothetical protein [Solwaraspora sp. WMMD406]MDG4763969.1 hypothetical protein [Solwaraspora sp. WMMD406]